MVDLITARRGMPHVSPKNDAAIWRSLVGYDSGVFTLGHQMGVYFVDNKAYIEDGLGMIQGRMFQADGTDVIDISIPQTGIRDAYLCFKVETNDEIQSGSWEILYGNVVPSGQTPPAPVVPDGDIDNGETAYLPICSFFIRPSGVSTIIRLAKSLHGSNTTRYKNYIRVDKGLGSTVGKISVAHNLNPRIDMWDRYELVSAWLTRDSDASISYALPYVDPAHSTYTIGINFDDTNVNILTGTSWNGYTAHFVFGEL